ncbi:MAG TPA: ATP-binding cassette domain-containing protein [Candidatus Avipropionibacterium avicola]|uniref:ATP-binding cassette domain-containing protein n=1 Tax=Candidatus Avipropionibacterium avicola TaxID=2840701 RepID=A0A9D1GZ57_9ACTN|nr:ATP-binding cassette domain-containing protein [Candidatus Avipropionibacterium avicola]
MTQTVVVSRTTPEAVASADPVITDLALRGETPAPEDIVFHLDRVTHTYGSRRARRRTAPAVDGLSLDILRNEVTVLFGRPRAGRSTILQLLSRIIEPEAGTLLFEGEALRRHRRRILTRRIGYLPAGGGLPPNRTVGEAITTLLRRQHWKPADAQARITEVFELLEIPPACAERRTSELAPWLRRAVGLAAVIAPDPDVLLLDEPFTISDGSRRSDLHAMMERVQQQRPRTVVVATDDFDEASRLADRIAVLVRPGRVVQYGRPREVIDAPVDDQVRSLIGPDRGWRALSLVPSRSLVPQRILAVRSPSAVPRDEIGLVLDHRAGPRGWVLPDRPGVVLGIGTDFDPSRDSLQTALDAALSSPVGQAVAVDRATGRYLGTVPIGRIIQRAIEVRRSSAIGINDEAIARRGRLEDRRRAEAAERARRQEAERARLLAEMSADSR